MIGKTLQKLKRSPIEFLTIFAEAVKLNTHPDEAEPLYRLHASRLKLLRDNKFDDFDLMEKFNYTYSEKQRDLEISDSAPSFPPTGGSYQSRHSLLVENAITALRECHSSVYKWFHKSVYQVALQLKLQGHILQAKQELSTLFSDKKTAKNFFKIYTHPQCTIERGGKRSYHCRKYTRLYLELLEATGDLNNFEVVTSGAKKENCLYGLALSKYTTTQIKFNSSFLVQLTTVTNGEAPQEKLEAADTEQVLRRAFETYNDIQLFLKSPRQQMSNLPMQEAANRLLETAFRLHTRQICSFVSLDEVVKWCQTLWTRSGKRKKEGKQKINNDSNAENPSSCLDEKLNENS